MNGQKRCATVKRIVAAVFLFLGFFFAGIAPLHPAIAQVKESQANVQEVAKSAGIASTTDLPHLIGRIIYILLSFVGVVLLVYLLYAGFLWMTAEGDGEQVKKAKAVIRNAIIGLVIIASSWAITAFIMNSLTDISGGTVSGSGSGANQFGLVSHAGALGKIIEYHLPERDATGVARNTPVIIAFKQPMDPATLISGWTLANSSTAQDLNATNIQIYRNDDPKNPLQPTDARVVYTKDQKTFVIRPKQLLGSPTNDIKYTVVLAGGASGLKVADGSPAFSGVGKIGYQWGFTVSTFVDNTPPKVLSVFPKPVNDNQGAFPRNVVVQMTFDEAIDPTTASGVVKNGAGFSNITLTTGENSQSIDGDYRLTNKFRTVEFTTNLSCGMNSCGREIFCLPPSATLNGNIHAASLDGDGPLAKWTDQGFDGVTDVAGNSLDGNGNNKAEGPGTDGYEWSFATTDEIKKDPPVILSTVPDASPGDGQSNRPVDEAVHATYDRLMQLSTFNSDTAYITPVEPQNPNVDDTFWYQVSSGLLNSKKEKMKFGEAAVYADLLMEHRPYLRAVDENPKNRNDYNPHLLSDIQDVYQNCFNPAASLVCKANPNAPNCCNNQATKGKCLFK